MEPKNEVVGYIRELRELVGQRPLINTGGRVIIENERQEILLIRRRDFGIWALPAGGLEIGETMQECVLREVEEETGLTLLDLTLVGVSSDPQIEQVTYPNGDQIQNMSLVFHATKWKGRLVQTTEETSEAAFFAPEKLPNMLFHEQQSITYFLNDYKTEGQPFLK